MLMTRQLPKTKASHFCKALFLMVPLIGFELMTYRLQGRCTHYIFIDGFYCFGIIATLLPQ